jgi:hypothetical protein
MDQAGVTTLDPIARHWTSCGTRHDQPTDDTRQNKAGLVVNGRDLQLHLVTLEAFHWNQKLSRNPAFGMLWRRADSDNTKASHNMNQNEVRQWNRNAFATAATYRWKRNNTGRPFGLATIMYAYLIASAPDGHLKQCEVMSTRCPVLIEVNL